MKHLLDTNMVIYALKKVPAVLAKLRGQSPDDLAISAVTLAELYFGACKSCQPEETRRKVEAFLRPWPVVDFDRAAAERYGETRCFLEKGGQPISERDLLIASIALSRGMTVVTRNTREFGRVPRLKVEDWWAE